MNYENYVKGRIVQYVAKEALDLGVEAMCGVAQVLRNRVQEGWGDWNVMLDMADSVAGTIKKPYTIDPRDPSFRRMLIAVDDIYYGLAADDNVNIDSAFESKRVALYYCDPNNCTNEWFRRNILEDEPNHRRLASIGPLIFFA